MRGDHIADDSPGKKIGQPAFQPVADLDADLAVGFGDQQDGAIVGVLLADFPGLGNPDGEILQRIAREGRNGQEGNLGRLLLLEVGQQRLQLPNAGRAEHAGVVVDVALETGDVEGRH